MTSAQGEERLEAVAEQNGEPAEDRSVSDAAADSPGVEETAASAGADRPSADRASPTAAVERTAADDAPDSADESLQPATAAARPATREATESPSESSPPSPAADTPTDGAASDARRAKAGGSRPKTRRAALTQAKLASLYRALRSRRPVEGRVEQVIRGGYEIRLGKIRAFCPHSQIDLHRVDDPKQHLGQTHRFRVVQVRRGGADVVVSRRAVLEDDRSEEAKAVRATLLEGAVMRGRIAGIAEFGAFVDLGAGVMGLVHVSELSHTRVSRVSDAVKIGEQVSVKILKLPESGKKISLSIRQANRDPWDDVPRRFRPGQVCPGTVRRVTDFGAFVELEPGVEALAPASEFPPSTSGWREKLESGGTQDWLVLAVDAKSRRLTVTPPAETGHMTPVLEVGAVVKGLVQRIEPFGVFVWLAPGRVGLMPNALSGVPRGEDVARRFPVAGEVEVQILDLDQEARRIRLARKGVAERSEPRRPRSAKPRPAPRSEPRPAPADPGPFGTSLADKLRAALARTEGQS